MPLFVSVGITPGPGSSAEAVPSERELFSGASIDELFSKLLAVLDGGCVSQDSDALVSQRGKESGEIRCKKSWDRFKENDSLSQRHVKQVSGKRKDHCWEKEMSKSFIIEVPTL